MSNLNLNKLKTSWTKYDIVQVMDVIHDEVTLKKYISKEATIDEPILRSFLGIKSLEEPIPEFWGQIINYPNEKKIFAFFALIFTHGEIIKKFASDYSTGNMKGIFRYEKGKRYTNLRSALVESGAAEIYLRRAQKVPYDFSPIYNNLEVGKLFKKLLENRILQITNKNLENSEFYNICYENDFHRAISANKELFRSWCEGNQYKPSRATSIKGVEIRNFYSIRDIQISIPDNTHEIYFLGENGDGKSLVLMAIYLAFNRHFIESSTEKEETGKITDILFQNRNSVLIGIDSNGKEYTERFGLHIKNFFAYGTYRGRYSTDNAEKYGFMSLFDNNEALANPISWLKDLKLSELNSTNEATNININNLQSLFYEILEKNVQVYLVGDEVHFIEKGKKLSFDQLSEGYRSVIIFLADLLMRLQKNQPDVKELKDFSGVVLVDEIDLHLHPKWQRNLVSKLRTILPKIQFIFTTHSPNVIQGADQSAVIYRVYRNSSDGFTRISDPYYRSDIDHLMINTLLTSPLFGLADSRLNPSNDNSTTSENYLIYRIHKQLEEVLEAQREAGKEFASKEEIDNLINNIIKEELKQ